MVAAMDPDADAVAARWREGLTRAAARAYEAAHGNPIPDQSKGVRWRIEPRVAVTVAVVAVVLAFITWSALRPASVAPIPPVVATEGIAADVVVHVAGAVQEPGLVTLPAGERIAEAIARAGGFAPDADADAINLAREVVDGEQVYVQVVGEQSGSTLINLNRASAQELESLPGVGPVLAGRIVADRDAHGPFATLDDLGRVPGVGPAIVGQISGLATV